MHREDTKSIRKIRINGSKMRGFTTHSNLQGKSRLKMCSLQEAETEKLNDNNSGKGSKPKDEPKVAKANDQKCAKRVCSASKFNTKYRYTGNSAWLRKGRRRKKQWKWNSSSWRGTMCADRYELRPTMGGRNTNGYLSYVRQVLSWEQGCQAGNRG